jgi:hypothetical protein
MIVSDKFRITRSSHGICITISESLIHIIRHRTEFYQLHALVLRPYFISLIRYIFATSGTVYDSSDTVPQKNNGTVNTTLIQP